MFHFLSLLSLLKQSSNHLFSCEAVKRIAAVPTLIESSRVPNKLLADTGGKLMIQSVLERCCEAKNLDAVVFCTDTDQLRELG